MRRRRLLAFATPIYLLASLATSPPVLAQSDDAYTASYLTNGVKNVFATSQKISCYRPEVPYPDSLTGNGYTGMSACPGATTGEDIGATKYPSQVGSNPGYPAANAMVVKNHSESDL